MKDFVSVNLVTYSKEHLSIILKHNIERKNFDNNIPYLLEKGQEIDKNVNLSYSNFEGLENKRQNYLKSKNKDDYMKKHLVEFVVSLSFDKVKDYIKDNQDIDKGFIQYVKDLKAQYAIETINLNIHKDEGFIENGEVKYNYHAHILAYNYNFDKNLAFASNLKKSDYRNLQTLAQNSFQSVGLDFKRGVSKFVTKKEHLNRNDYIKQEKQKQLKSLFVDISTQKKELKKIYSEINKQKIEMKKQRDLYQKVDLEYQTFNEQYLQLQSLEKQKRQEYKALENSINFKKIEVENVEKYEKYLKNDIANIVKEHTQKISPIVGKPFYKVEDRNKMFEKLVTKIKEPLNVQLNDIEHLKRENQSLKNENSKMVQKDLQNQKLIRNLELEKTQNKQFIDKQSKKINKLQNKSLILISFFKSLGLKINHFKKYFKSQKQQQKSYFIDR
ncbi:coiled-coil domain-containing protein [Aliarcobacter butzleri]|uniref:hypothetical protein n=1 Tax=Aliarcobacter butzleri TaxID=28197 RepID=UPI0021B272DA|nr:hypothetical protein [Aliarcobacter butzleri]MCT7596710.1 hypothetical protein [Aliarcobacter butzleri]